MINLPLSRIPDEPVRSSFRELQDAFNGSVLNLADFALYEVTTTAAVTNQDMAHNLGFIPTDVIVTRISGGSVTWSYDSFTNNKVVFSTSGATTIRFLLGKIS